MTVLSATSASAMPAGKNSLPPMAVLGTGRVGQAIAYDLLTHGAERILLVDMDEERLGAVGSRLSAHGEVTRVQGDLTDPSAVMSLLDGVATVISAVPYRLNLPLARLAVEQGHHWVDLGGNTEVVEATLALDAKAKKKGVSVIPDAGLQPGLGNILAGDLHRRLGGADELRVLVGGLPQQPTGELKYQLVFSIEGLLNEYHGAVRTLWDTHLREREPLTDVEPFAWSGMPELECFHTSGSASTLPGSFEGKVGRVEVKTVRYAGHAATLERIFSEVPVSQRASHFTALLPAEGADLVLMRVEGRKGTSQIIYEMEDRSDPVTGFSAMMRTTGFPASIVAALASTGQLPTGAVVQERDVPAEPVVAGLMERGITVQLHDA